MQQILHVPPLFLSSFFSLFSFFRCFFLFLFLFPFFSFVLCFSFCLFFYFLLSPFFYFFFCFSLFNIRQGEEWEQKITEMSQMGIKYIIFQAVRKKWTFSSLIFLFRFYSLASFHSASVFTFYPLFLSFLVFLLSLSFNFILSFHFLSLSTRSQIMVFHFIHHNIILILQSNVEMH